MALAPDRPSQTVLWENSSREGVNENLPDTSRRSALHADHRCSFFPASADLAETRESISMSPLATSKMALRQRGRYLVMIAGCNDCHTPGFAQKGEATPETEWLAGDSVGRPATGHDLPHQPATLRAEYFRRGVGGVGPGRANAAPHATVCAQNDDGRRPARDIPVRQGPWPQGLRGPSKAATQSRPEDPLYSLYSSGPELTWK